MLELPFGIAATTRTTRSEWCGVAEANQDNNAESAANVAPDDFGSVCFTEPSTVVEH
jgi:hypothetical protein